MVESNVIGPTLGKDSIEAGQRGLVVALLLVMLFMAIYYKLSGVVADFVLLLNVFFLLATMFISMALVSHHGDEHAEEHH